MPICAVYWTPPEDENRYGRQQVQLVSILPDGETGVIMYRRTFIKVSLAETEWARWD